MKRPILLAMAIAFVACARFAAPEEPVLTVVWHDSTRLYPAVGLGLLGAEIEGLFRAYGLPVRFRPAKEHEDLSAIAEPRVNAVLIGGDGLRFGVAPNAMAVTIGEVGEKHSIFVFFDPLNRALGDGSKKSFPRGLAEMARALARVVAHEVVHVLAPQRGHAGSGLMTQQLTRGQLTGRSIELDPASLSDARERLATWGKCPDELLFRRALTGRSQIS